MEIHALSWRKPGQRIIAWRKARRKVMARLLGVDVSTLGWDHGRLFDLRTRNLVLKGPDAHEPIPQPIRVRIPKPQRPAYRPAPPPRNYW